MPYSKENSCFFEIAPKVEELLLQETLITRSQEVLPTHPLYEPFIGPEITAEVLTTEFSSTGSITTISTPEAEIISGLGGFVPNTSGELVFIPPRFHLGPPAQIDMAVATHHLAQTSRLKNLQLSTDSQQSGIVMFTREGHLTDWQRAIYFATGQSLPTTLVTISHQDADNSFTRQAVIRAQPNLEGFNLGKLNVLHLCDPVASGMQQIAVLEYFESINSLPKQVIIIAPMATRFGMSVIECWCRERQINFLGLTCATLLDSYPPLFYYSPYPKSASQIARPIAEIADQVLSVFPETRGCIRCNWTASLMGNPELALSQSEEELKNLGTSNTELRQSYSWFTPQMAKEVGLLDSYLPFSTRLALRRPS